MFCLQRGSLNGTEWLLDAMGFPVQFNTIEEAKAFCIAEGFDESYIEEFDEKEWDES